MVRLNFFTRNVVRYWSQIIRNFFFKFVILFLFCQKILITKNKIVSNVFLLVLNYCFNLRISFVIFVAHAFSLNTFYYKQCLDTLLVYCSQNNKRNIYEDEQCFLKNIKTILLPILGNWMPPCKQKFVFKSKTNMFFILINIFLFYRLIKFETLCIIHYTM